jgi:GNAT superfamily N-acetyltransferase
LGERFERSFDARRSIPADPEDLRPPRGTFLVARLDGRPVGCGAVKSVEPGVGSIKRMWVSPAVRRAGVGRRLLLALEEEAAGLGMGLLRLETSRSPKSSVKTTSIEFPHITRSSLIAQRYHEAQGRCAPRPAREARFASLAPS